jgi:ABC-type transport system involved in cytochrome c biogenesis permease component
MRYLLGGIDKTTRDEHIENMLFFLFVSTLFSMVFGPALPPHNKEKS